MDIEMYDKLKMIGVAVIGAFGLAFIIMLIVLVVGVIMAFYEVFIKKPEVDQSQCAHENLRYTDSHPDKSFTCVDCRKLL